MTRGANRKGRDRKRRKRLRERLEAKGVDQETIDRIIAQKREDDLARRLNAGGGLSREEILANTDDSLWPDDAGYRPRRRDPLLHGPGRADGMAAKVAKRRETITRWQYDREVS